MLRESLERLQELIEEKREWIVTDLFQDYLIGLQEVNEVLKENKGYSVPSIPKIRQLTEKHPELKAILQKEKPNIYTNTSEILWVVENGNSVETQYVALHEMTLPKITRPQIRRFKEHLRKSVGDRNLNEFVEGIYCLSEETIDLILDGGTKDGGYFPRVPIMQAKEGRVPEPGTLYAIVASYSDNVYVASHGLRTPEELRRDDRRIMIGGGPEGVEICLPVQEQTGSESLKRIYNSNNLFEIIKDMSTLSKTGPLMQPVHLSPGGGGIATGFHYGPGSFILARTENPPEGKSYQNLQPPISER